MAEEIRPIIWMASSKRDLRAMPEAVQDHMGYALHLAQAGDKDADAKPLKGFGGAGVVEIVSNHDGDAFRGIYTVKLRRAVYVLHVFQKKSKRGAATPKAELDLIDKRLRDARKLDEDEGGNDE